MNILITGGTGFIASHLVKALLLQHHTVVLFCRNEKKAQDMYDGRVACVHSFNEVSIAIDTVINLSGEAIMDKRWSKRRKHQLRVSRIDITRHLIKWMATLDTPPKVLISGSAIGYYGNYPEDTPLDEYAKSRSCFPSSLCSEWEFESLKAKALGVRVCMIRTGVVLDKYAGALQKMWLPFSLGLGGNVATGKQWLSWVHIDDMVKLIMFIMQTPSLEGPVNATAPVPVTYHQFTRCLAKVLARPHWVPMPTLLLKLLFGESAQLLYEGQRVVPSALTQAGFTFEYNDIDAALSEIVTR